MIKKLKRYFEMMLVYSKYNIQSSLEYPAYLIGWVFSNALQFAFGVITLNVITSNFQPLGGWTFNQVVFMYGLGIISHGLSVVLFVQMWYMDYSVTEGEFDRLLTRPLSTFFQYSFSNINFIGFTDMIPGIIIFIYGCISIGFSCSFINIIRLILVIVGATLLRGGIYTIIGSLSFWVKRTNKLIDVSLQIFDYSNKYPISIYPVILQSVLTFLIPVGFICFYPASEFLNIETTFHIPGSLCLWTLFIGIMTYIISIVIYHCGIKSYESSGS
ncbi:hypothetical protein SDC9_84074 [bioreactor metagenome]|uniref:ABC-2 type transporter domain-containing protein n=1 Tax=bioreactor metagenome TaxID=1076179 RepID=A0A644Z9W3_9ZZZZ|nr:ABC-2 family transporter protein [Oscillospiraceae bacterium]